MNFHIIFLLWFGFSCFWCLLDPGSHVTQVDLRITLKPWMPLISWSSYLFHVPCAAQGGLSPFFAFQFVFVALVSCTQIQAILELKLWILSVQTPLASMSVKWMFFLFAVLSRNLSAELEFRPVSLSVGPNSVMSCLPCMGHQKSAYSTWKHKIFLCIGVSTFQVDMCTLILYRVNLWSRHAGRVRCAC